MHESGQGKIRCNDNFCRDKGTGNCTTVDNMPNAKSDNENDDPDVCEKTLLKTLKYVLKIRLLNRTV